MVRKQQVGTESITYVTHPKVLDNLQKSSGSVDQSRWQPTTLIAKHDWVVKALKDLGFSRL